MDGDDPEQRIADLERQLAEPKPSAGPPSVGTLDASTSRRFVAFAAPPTTRQMGRYSSVAFIVAIASLGAVNMALFLVGALLDATAAVMQVGGSIVFFGFLLGAMPAYAAFQRRIYRDKSVLIHAGSDRLTVSARPGDVFAFSDAHLGVWKLEGYKTTLGTALHLRHDTKSFVLGARDHRIAGGVQLDAPPAEAVDAWMWPPQFDELLTAIGRRHGPDVQDETTRCLLVPNPVRSFSTSFFGMFKSSAAAPKVTANPPQSMLAIDVSDDAIAVIDLKTNAVIASAPPAQITATPAECTRSMPRVGKMTTPVLVVRIPNSPPLTIECPDFAGPPQVTWKGRTKFTYRFTWRGEVPDEQGPAYVIGDADWLTLVEKFGLAPRLEDRVRTGRDEAPTPAQAPLARPKRKLWPYVVLAAVLMFVVAPVLMMVAGSMTTNRQLKDDLLKADHLRPFALPFKDLRVPHGVAVDGAGNVYVTDSHTNRVLKLAAGTHTQTVLPFTGLDFCANDIDAATASVAVDVQGAVYVTDSCHERVVKLAAGSTTQTVLPFRGLESPQGVAVDTAGTVYVVDISHGHIFKLEAGATKATILPPIQLSGDVAVDISGNLYVSCTRGRVPRSCLMRLAPGSNTWTRLPSIDDHSGDTFSTGEQDVAVDAAGNVYMIASRQVMKLAPGADNWTTLPGVPSLVDPMGLAVDAAGTSVYVSDHVGSRATGSLLPWEKDDAQGFVLKLPAN